MMTIAEAFVAYDSRGLATTTSLRHRIARKAASPQEGGKRRKRRKQAAAASSPTTPQSPPSTESNLIVDEPGKLVGKPLADTLRSREQEKTSNGDERPLSLDDLRRDVELLGGRRPDDPTDAFDYGVGGLIKQTVYILAAALVIFDLYINSPFFQRAAPPPIVTAVVNEVQKYPAPVEQPTTEQEGEPGQL